MAEYKKQIDKKNREKLELIIQDFPSYLRGFFLDNPGETATTTLVTYAYDIQDFLRFEKQALPKSVYSGIKKIPITVFQQIDSDDITEYKKYLQKESERNRQNAETYRIRRVEYGESDNATAKLPLSKNIVRRHLASLSALLSWMRFKKMIDTDPMRDVSRPKYESGEKILVLSASQTKELLDGILSNRKIVMRSSKDNGEDFVVKELSPEERQKRDRFVARDYAIIILLLGTGMRVSELVGINIEDVNLSDSCVHVVRKGNRDDYVYFGKDVAEALQEYSNGMSVPVKIMNRYDNINEIMSYITNHTYSPTLFDTLRERYNDGCDTFDDDMKVLWKCVRRSGRKALRPKVDENAYFISSRGRRISVRMVQKIVKDAVIAYVPDCDDAVHFSPHKLRSTAASRVLRQTGNISYAQEMLGHKSPTTTSKFYAKLTKDDMKRQAAESSLTEGY